MIVLLLSGLVFVSGCSIPWFLLSYFFLHLFVSFFLFDSLEFLFSGSLSLEEGVGHLGGEAWLVLAP